MEPAELHAILRHLSAGDATSLDVANDETALSWQTLSRYVHALAHRAASALARDYQDYADDVAQDVIVSLTDPRRLHALARSDNPAGYLFTMVRHRVNSTSRTELARQRRQDAWAVHSQMERESRDTHAGPAAAVDVQDMIQRRLQTCLERLADIDRRLLDALYLQQKSARPSYRELGIELGLSETNVAQRVRRALARLRAMLDETT